MCDFILNKIPTHLNVRGYMYLITKLNARTYRKGPFSPPYKISIITKQNSKRKVGCSNPSRDRPKSLTQVVTAPMPNVYQSDKNTILRTDKMHVALESSQSRYTYSMALKGPVKLLFQGINGEKPWETEAEGRRKVSQGFSP